MQSRSNKIIAVTLAALRGRRRGRSYREIVLRILSSAFSSGLGLIILSVLELLFRKRHHWWDASADIGRDLSVSALVLTATFIYKPGNLAVSAIVVVLLLNLLFAGLIVLIQNAKTEKDSGASFFNPYGTWDGIGCIFFGALSFGLTCGNLLS